jgi:lysophospholipase L1-like esterase
MKGQPFCAAAVTALAALGLAAVLSMALAADEAPNVPDLPSQKVVIAMLGDSITYGGRWNELLGRQDVSNHGVSGDTTDRVFARLPAVFEEGPRICFVMAGVNDIAHGFPVEIVFSNLRRIVKDLRTRRIIPVVQATLYTRIPQYNRRIERLNKMLAKFARKNSLDYMDLNAALARNKLLDVKYTSDGIHLRAAAYEQWRRHVEFALNRHKIKPPRAAPVAPQQTEPEHAEPVEGDPPRAASTTS